MTDTMRAEQRHGPWRLNPPADEVRQMMNAVAGIGTDHLRDEIRRTALQRTVRGNP